MNDTDRPSPPARVLARVAGVLLSVAVVWIGVGLQHGVASPADLDEVDEVVALEGSPEAGRLVFTEVADPACGSCHTLRDAGADGDDAPDLDALRPTERQVIGSLVSEEVGAHAAQGFADQLSDQQVADVAAYVAGATDDDVGRFDVGRAVEQSAWSVAVLLLAAVIALTSVTFMVLIVNDIRSRAGTR